MELVGVWTSIKASGELSSLNSLVLELLSQVISQKTRLSHSPHAELLRSIFSASADSQWVPFLQELVTDIIWLLDLENGSPERPSTPNVGSSESIISTLKLVDSRNEVVNLTAELLNSGFMTAALALERLEPDFLESMGVVASADIFNKKMIKINTALFYRQQKFNLLREESEGFARLMIFLASTMNFNAKPALSLDLVFERILEMIGYFELDPGKVLDILIDEFVAGLPHWRNHLDLLKRFAFSPENLAGILGFRLVFVHRDRKFNVGHLDQLMAVVALLLTEKMISLELIWPYLLPSDDDSRQERETVSKNLHQAAKNLNVVNLSISSSSNSASESSWKQSLEPDSLTEHFAQDALSQTIQAQSPERNLKARLCAALLRVGNAELAAKVLGHLPCLSALSADIAKGICDVIETLISPLYCAKVDLISSSLPAEFHEISASGSLQSWLQFLPPGGLSSSPRLFTKLCRLNSHLKEEIPSMISCFLLPALAASSCQASLVMAQELWTNCLSILEYSERFALYGNWRKFYVAENLGQLCKANAISEARKVMRRLAKENVRQYGRLVAKLTLSNPLIVLPLIIDQLQVYDNLIPSIVEAFRFLSPLSFDVLMFSLLQAMTGINPEAEEFGPRDRLKEDGTNVADWLQNLAQFSALLFRKYHSILEFRPLVRFIYSQLVDDNVLDLVILQDLLFQACAVDRPENANETVQEALAAGGPALQEIVVQASQQAAGLTKVSKRPGLRLLEALDAESLTLPLLLALGQAADAAVYRMDYSHLKLTSSLVDKCQSAFLQYLTFLKESGVLSGKKDGLSLTELVNVHKLELPIAMLISVPHLSIEDMAGAIETVFNFQNQLPPFLPVEFLCYFWTRSLGDFHVPEALYLKESICLNRDEAKRAALQKELLARHEHCEQQLKNLFESSRMWFVGCRERTAIIKGILKIALLPRVLLGASDARFSAKLLFLLHQHATPHFSTLSLLDSVFDLPLELLGALTEHESHSFGHFFHDVMLQLQRWQLHPEEYEAEAIGGGKLGFLKRWTDILRAAEDRVEEGKHNETDVDTEPGQLEAGDGSRASGGIADTGACEISCNPLTSAEQLSWEDFRHVLYKWHQKLNSCVLSLLQSSQYCQIRNAVIFLSHLLLPSNNVFPCVDKMSLELESAVSSIKENDRREDLKLLATRYSAMLQQNRPKLLREHLFHQCDATSLEPSPAKAVKRSSDDLLQDGRSTDKRPKREPAGAKVWNQNSRDRDAKYSADSKDSKDSRDGNDSRDGKDRHSRDSSRESSRHAPRAHTSHTRDRVREWDRDKDSREHTPNHRRSDERDQDPREREYSSSRSRDTRRR